MSDELTFDELTEQADMLDNGPEKVALLEQAVREADAMQDVSCGMDARMMLVEAATFSGFQEKALVAFSWCLSQVDKNPDEFHEGSMLWSYKWVMQNCHAFPQISRRQIEHMLDDYQQRLTRHSHSLRSAHYLRWSCLMHLGDLDEAQRVSELWRKSPNDAFADCPACERDISVQLLIHQHHDEEALKQAQPILSGRLSCAEIPHITLAWVLEPLLRCQRLDEAEKHHAKGYRMVAKNQDFLLETARHLVYLVSQDKLVKSVNLLERHLPWAVETSCVDRRFHFYSASALCLEKLAGKKDRPRKLRLPRKLACYRDDDTYQPAELAGWFAAEAASLAGRFNERNGNDFFTRLAAEQRRLAMGA